jgi:hypothetical protein
MSEIMSQIFNESKMIVGFDSTGPLGAQSAPLLQKAFNASTAQDKSSTGISAVALKAQFARHNLRLISPQAHKGDEIFAKALGANSIDSTAAWREILSSNQSVKRYYDFIMRQSENATLVALVQRDMIIKVNVANGFSEVIKMAKGLSAIQLKTLNLLKRFRLIEDAEHQSEIQKVVSQILTKPIDYVSADQLCEIFKKQKSSVISREHEAKISKSEYSEFLNKCRGLNVKVYYSNVFKCLVGDGSRRSDWDCLTQYASELDVESCKFAKARNTDPENADDMVWFCYDQLKNWGQLNKPVCLELTHSFSILGNQLKMNWNCLNRVQ